jgi:seryl-tRNA synthetase
MLDVRLLRTDFDGVTAAMSRRHNPSLLSDLEQARDLDARQRELIGERDAVRARVNALSKEVGALRRDGHDLEAQAKQEQSRGLGEQHDALDAELDGVADGLHDLLLRIPNIPSPDAPDGTNETENVVVRVIGSGEESYGDHQRVPHWDVGSELGILDLERAVKLSGSMFSMFRGQGATLARGLCQLALDRNADAFEEVRPPSLVLTSTLTATGQLPKFADDAYHLERDDLWCIPTAEVPLTSIAKDEILDEGELPMRLMGYTPCFRREAGSAGRDTRGLLRVHEFDKVEIFAYATPDQAPAMLDELLHRAESTIAALGLTYRIVDICTGDLGQSHYRSFDIEVYAPGVDQWLEVSSVSWFSDYQARRANVRYRPAGEKRAETVHTLNGSALAVPRVWAAIVETHRRPDGAVQVPDVLRPYMRGDTTIGPARRAGGG